MKKLLLTLLLLPMFSYAQLAVIVHPDNPTNSIKKSQVTDLFMGRVRSFSDGSFALPIDQAPLRVKFYKELTDRNIEQINAYWARIMFSGQASPPLVVPNNAAVLKTVSANEGAIGYVDAAYVNDTVKVILIIP